MQSVDFSPPRAPTLDQQRDALRKGLGRAKLWAVAGRLDDEPLLDACLHDGRHDMQVEDSRGDWLWSIIVAVGGADRLREPILEALHELPDHRSAVQLCELAYHFAAAGDERFRDRLYEIVARKPIADDRRLGEDELLRLDQERGFLFAAGFRGESLATREWEWSDDNLIYDAVEQFGADRVNRLLEDAADESVRKFGHARRAEEQRKAEQKLQKRQTQRTPYQKRQQRLRAIRVEDILAEAVKDHPDVSNFRGWGVSASDCDLANVLERLWTANDPSTIINLLKIFSNRPLPEFNPRLIEFCRHDDENVRRWAFNALKRNAHPTVREFALAEVHKGMLNHFVLGLFTKNYAKGDETWIRELLDSPEEPNELHWLLMDIIKILQNNPEADCSELALIVYADTPCENCRCDAARLLQSQNAAPDWLIAECRHDSSEECRAVFQPASDSESEEEFQP